MDRSSIDADALKYTYGVSQRVKNSQNWLHKQMQLLKQINKLQRKIFQYKVRKILAEYEEKVTDGKVVKT
jgi:hypothetical protein